MVQEEIYKLHQKYSQGAEGSLDLVWGHSLIVKDIVDQLADNLNGKQIKINRELAEIGAMVHDIGCYDYYKKANDMPYIQHGVRGYEILKKEGFDEEICRMAMIHLGVGLVKENVIENKLPLEVKDYIPITLEEEAVAYADNFHSKNGPKFMEFEEAKNKLMGFWPESGIIFERFKKKFGIPDLEKFEKWEPINQ